jgi:hypothetical protein
LDCDAGLASGDEEQSVQTEQTWTDVAHLNRIHHVLQGLVYFTASMVSKWMGTLVEFYFSFGGQEYSLRQQTVRASLPPEAIDSKNGVWYNAPCKISDI